MNVLFTHSFRAANGWRWRLEFHTADPAPLASPTIVPLPENSILIDSLKWECRFADLPLGMTDTPKFTVSFNLAALLGSPALEHFRQCLQQPFVIFNVPPITVPGYTEERQIWVQDPNDSQVGGWETETNVYPPGTLEPDIKDFKLTNFLTVRCDKGESALAESAFYFMFTGCQGLSPTVKYGNFSTKGFLRFDATFNHSARFVMEQVNADMLATYVQKYTPISRNYAVNVGFDDVPKKVRILEQPKDVSDTYAGMLFYKVFDFIQALDDVTKEVAQKVERKALSGVIIPTGSIGFGRFKATNPANFSLAANVNTDSMYFIGNVSEPPNWERRGGLLDKGSPLYKLETMFDYVKNSCEAGCIARYDVFTSWHHEPIRGTSSGVTLKQDDIEFTDGEGGFSWLRGVEMAMQNISNVRYTGTGAALANTDWALNLFWHNATGDGEGEKIEKDDSDRIVSQKYSCTKLYADAGGEMFAVHPSCGYDNGQTVVNSPVVNKTMPNDLTGVLRRKEGWGKPEYDYIVRDWTETTGLHTLVAQELLKIYGNYEQMKFTAKTARGTVVKDVLPLAVGTVFALDAGLFPSYAPQANKAFLLSSVLDVFTGVAELEFFAPKAGIL